MPVSTIERRRAIWEAASASEAQAVARTLAADRRASLSTIGVAITPDASGNSGPLINDRLQELGAQGGGVLTLTGGGFFTRERLVLPSRCGLRGAGKDGTLLRKHAAFPDGDTLLDASGLPSSASGENHNKGMTIENINLNAGINPKAGLLLAINYTSTSTFSGLRVSGALGRAIEARQAWDHAWFDLQSNCPGGNSGDAEADAVMAILGSPNDKSNLQRFFGTRFESFRNCCVYIGSSGYAGSGPYSITFVSPKFESGALIDGATLVKSDGATAGISIRDAYLFFGAAAARTGVRGLDLDGTGHIIDGVTASTTASVQMISVVRTPRQSGGGVVRDVRTIGSGTFAAGCGIIEQDALRPDGNPVVYDARALRLEGIRPYGSVPLLGANPADLAAGRNGAETIPVQFPQLAGSIAPVALGSNRNLRGSDLNRIVRASTNNAFTLNLQPGVASSGDVVTVAQDAGGVGTLTAQAPGVLKVPAGLSASTTGLNTQVRAVCESANSNTWRIIP